MQCSVKPRRKRSDLLPQLHDRLPCVFGSNTVTIFAGEVFDDILNHKRLLQNRSSENLYTEQQFKSLLREDREGERERRESDSRHGDVGKQLGAMPYFFLHSELCLNALGVRLGPHEGCIDQLDFVQSPQALDAHREELTRLPGARHPGAGRLQVPATGNSNALSAHAPKFRVKLTLAALRARIQMPWRTARSRDSTGRSVLSVFRW